MNQYRYPCTGQISHVGFGEFLEAKLGTPRANLLAFGTELEAAFGARHITLVNSGSSANLVASLALAEEVGNGSHAISAGFSFPTTLSSLQMAGFNVTLVDTQPDNWNIDPEAIRRALRADTRVLCVTHFLGYPAPIDILQPLIQERKLLVLQDCCETMGLEIAGRAVESFGTLSTWSFYHPHHLSAYGGGAVLSPDAKWRQRVESLSHWGRACTCHYDSSLCPAPEGIGHFFHYVRPGLNVEMSELNACFGRFQLQKWQQIELRRRQNAALLHAELSDCPAIRVFPLPREGASPFVFPLAPTRVNLTDFARKLANRGVETRNLMGAVAADQPGFASMPHDGLFNCRKVAAETCFVGVHHTLPVEDIRAVAAIIREEATL